MSDGEYTFPVIDDGGSQEQPKTPVEVWRYCLRAAAHYEQRASDLREQGRAVDAAIAQKKSDWSNRFAALWEQLAKESRSKP